MSGSRRKPEIKSNTAFRGIGACWVLLFHFNNVRLVSGDVISVFDLSANLNLLLDLFFLLSGFIMAYIYAEAFGQGFSGKAVGKFLWFRFARIYPLHIFAIAVFLAERGAYIALATHNVGDITGADPSSFFHTDQYIENTPWTLIASALLIHAWGVTSQISWNYPSWASSAEFAAYLLFPFMCVLIGRFGRAGLAILIACGIIAYVSVISVFGSIDVPATMGALRTIPGFTIGVALYVLSPSLRHLSRRPLDLLQALALAATIAAFWFAKHDFVIVVAMALLLFSTAENRGWLSTALTWQPLQFLGRISFTLYTMHVVTGIAVKQVLVVAQAHLGINEVAPWWLYLGLALKIGATVIVSIYAYRLVEMPARLVLDKLVKRPKQVAPTPMTSPVTAPASLMPAMGAQGEGSIAKSNS